MNEKVKNAEQTSQTYPEYNVDYAELTSRMYADYDDKLIYDMIRHLTNLKNLWNWIVKHSETPLLNADFIQGKLYKSDALSDNIINAINNISDIIAYAIKGSCFSCDKKETIK